MSDPIGIGSIAQLQDGIEFSPQRQELGTNEAGGGSFADMLSRAIEGVDDSMKESDQKVQDLIAGKTENVHDVMISMQKAQLSFQLMVEVRNKAIEAYQEISRMQI